MNLKRIQDLRDQAVANVLKGVWQQRAETSSTQGGETKRRVIGGWQRLQKAMRQVRIGDTTAKKPKDS